MYVAALSLLALTMPQIIKIVIQRLDADHNTQMLTFLGAVGGEHGIAAAHDKVRGHVDVLYVLVAELQVVLVLLDLRTRTR